MLGVVPARKGSRGVLRKNLSPLGGRSLLAWTADAARESVTLSRIVLSTDDDEIAQAGLAAGLEVPFRRPAALAADDTPILEVLQHVLCELARVGYEPDVVVLLQPTSPFRRAVHIDTAVTQLETTGASSVVTVVEVPHQFNPVSVLREQDGRLVPFVAGPLITRRQDKPPVFARNGPAVLAVRATTLRAGSLYGDDVRGLVMSAEDSIDIDGPGDLRLAEWLLQQRQ